MRETTMYHAFMAVKVAGKVTPLHLRIINRLEAYGAKQQRERVRRTSALPKPQVREQ